MAIVIDTHAAIQALEKAGFEQNKAEAIVKVVGSQSEHPATKLDLSELKVQLLLANALSVGIIIAVIKLI